MGKKLLGHVSSAKEPKICHLQALFLPDLPRFHVDDNATSSHTGLHSIGPLLVTGKNGDLMKCYVCLYKCLSTRAVHLELVEGLDVIIYLFI